MARAGPLPRARSRDLLPREGRVIEGGQADLRRLSRSYRVPQLRPAPRRAVRGVGRNERAGTATPETYGVLVSKGGDRCLPQRRDPPRRGRRPRRRRPRSGPRRGRPRRGRPRRGRPRRERPRQASQRQGSGPRSGGAQRRRAPRRGSGPRRGGPRSRRWRRSGPPRRRSSPRLHPFSPGRGAHRPPFLGFRSPLRARLRAAHAQPMVTTTADHTPVADAVRTPSVLVVLVVSNGARWLRENLRSLAGQTHPKLGVIAVDGGSRDGSREILQQALGPKRLIALPEDRGLSGALRAALDLPVARAADYVLVLHDDAALASDAVTFMVEAAEGLRGVERVGIVGPKVVDWYDPAMLREVGRSTDRFGHPHTPLQDGELDQGQYDRILEVLYVSSCAMLISREAWQRTGPFDER